MNVAEYLVTTEADIEILVDFRIAFLTDLLGEQPEEQVAALRKNLRNYFEKAIANKSYIGLVARVSDEIVSIGGMTIREHPGSFKNPLGKTAYIMNMYTVPQHRKQGHCSTILNKLTDLATEMGIHTFELHTTKAGEPVYQKCGFEKHSEPTYRKFRHANA